MGTVLSHFWWPWLYRRENHLKNGQKRIKKKLISSLCGNLNAGKYILDELNSSAKQYKLRGFEMLRTIHLEPVPFDIGCDLVTPTFKLKRPQLLKYYKDYVDQMYSDAKGQNGIATK